MKTLSKKKEKSVAQLKKVADKVFSQYIRRRDEGQCITCPKRDHWKRMQNGHYVSRAYNSLRYSEVNCNCQCAGCNIFKRGNMDEYAMNLQRKHGTDVLKELAEKKKELKQWTVPELQSLISTYKQKIKELP